jgi:hypothetical protein
MCERSTDFIKAARARDLFLNGLKDERTEVFAATHRFLANGLFQVWWQVNRHGHGVSRSRFGV